MKRSTHIIIVAAIVVVAVLVSIAYFGLRSDSKKGSAAPAATTVVTVTDPSVTAPLPPAVDGTFDQKSRACTPADKESFNSIVHILLNRDANPDESLMQYTMQLHELFAAPGNLYVVAVGMSPADSCLHAFDGYDTPVVSNATRSR